MYKFLKKQDEDNINLLIDSTIKLQKKAKKNYMNIMNILNENMVGRMCKISEDCPKFRIAGKEVGVVMIKNPKTISVSEYNTNGELSSRALNVNVEFIEELKGEILEKTPAAPDNYWI